MSSQIEQIKALVAAAPLPQEKRLVIARLALADELKAKDVPLLTNGAVLERLQAIRNEAKAAKDAPKAILYDLYLQLFKRHSAGVHPTDRMLRSQNYKGKYPVSPKSVQRWTQRLLPAALSKGISSTKALKQFAGTVALALLAFTLPDLLEVREYSKSVKQSYEAALLDLDLGL